MSPYYFTCKWKQMWWWGLRRPTRVQWWRLHKLASLEGRKEENDLKTDHNQSFQVHGVYLVNGNFLFRKQSATSIYRDEQRFTKLGRFLSDLPPFEPYNKFKLKNGINLSFWTQSGICYPENCNLSWFHFPTRWIDFTLNKQRVMCVAPSRLYPTTFNTNHTPSSARKYIFPLNDGTAGRARSEKWTCSTSSPQPLILTLCAHERNKPEPNDYRFSRLTNDYRFKPKSKWPENWTRRRRVTEPLLVLIRIKTYYYRGILYHQIRKEACPVEDHFCLLPSECDGLERPQVVLKRRSSWPQPSNMKGEIVR